MQGPQDDSKLDMREEVETSLMNELAGTFRPGDTKDRIIRIEAKLKPLFAAVPQSDDGTLSHSVVRYVLHRFFMQRGWSIRGLQPSSNEESERSWSGSENHTLNGVVEWVPTFLHGLLEQLHGGRGISVRELAVLAATLEDVIHKESNYHLQKALYLSNDILHSFKREYDDKAVMGVLTVYMLNYLLQRPDDRMPSGRSRYVIEYLKEKVGHWHEVEEWMKSVRWQVHPTGPVDMHALTRIVEAVAEQYGDLHARQCARLKSNLLGVESKKPGRVRLAEYYNLGLNARLAGDSRFDERVDYLNGLGAIDDSDPKDPLVIVPNYLASRPNCITGSRLFMICCRNECEDLMSRLEDDVKDNLAAPRHLLKLVAELSSETVDAPRRLSATLIQRLNSIAEINGGLVPLHGRLFAQWMHHAFPRECPFPHEAGSVNGLTPDAWIGGKGEATHQLSEEALLAHVDGSGSTQDHPKAAETGTRSHFRHFEETELPWKETEELLIPIRESQLSSLRLQARLYHGLRTFIVFVVLSSMAYEAKVMLYRSAETDSEMKLV